MVALALDIGGTRTGIAVSDRTGRVAMPLKVLPAAEVENMSRTFRMIVEDHEPDVLVCGLPQTMAGKEGRRPSASARSPSASRAHAGSPSSSSTSACPPRRPSASSVSRV